MFCIYLPLKKSFERTLDFMRLIFNRDSPKPLNFATLQRLKQRQLSNIRSQLKICTSYLAYICHLIVGICLIWKQCLQNLRFKFQPTDGNSKNLSLIRLLNLNILRLLQMCLKNLKMSGKYETRFKFQITHTLPWKIFF